MKIIKQVATALKSCVSSRLYLAFAIALIVLNAVDAVLTLYDITVFDGSYEFNPIMAILYAKGPVWFFSVKYCLGAFGVILMLAYIHKKSARYGLLGACGLYFCVVVYHVIFELYLS